MKLIIKNGHVIDPANKIDDIMDILVEDEKISKVARAIDAKAETVIDAVGKIVMPGIVDMHVHLREPGREDEETILTGTRAAVKGGFTSVACMPNTEAPLDNPAIIKSLKETIEKTALTNVFIVGTITESRAGKRPTDFHKMKKEGVTAVSDDGACVDDEKVMLESMQQSKEEATFKV